MSIKSRIRTIADFPKKGVMFRDITTLLQDATGFRITLHKLVNRYRGKKIHKVAAIESRGFIIGAPLSCALEAGFVPLRKKASAFESPRSEGRGFLDTVQVKPLGFPKRLSH